MELKSRAKLRAKIKLKKAIEDLLKTIGKENVKPIHLRRFKSKNAAKPGPILLELSEGERNPLLLASKKLREKQDFKEVYICPDLTEAERLQDFELRKKRNDLNSKLDANSPFRYAIRGNEIVRFKKQL